MRVLHLTRDFPPRSTGGLSSAVGGLVDALDTVEHTIVSFDDWRPRRNDTRTNAVEVATAVAAGVTGVARVTSETALASVQAFVRACQVDVVHVHDAMLWQLAGESSAPTLYSVHVHHAAQDALRGVSPTQGAQAEAQALAGSALVHAPSRSVAAALSVPSHVAALGCLPVEATAARPTAGSAPPVVFAVGRFADMKGTDVFAAAAGLSKSPPARWRWAGGMPVNARGERRWRTRRLGSLDLAGWLGPEQLAAEYRAATVVVVPSRIETFGLAALDALRFGCPIVASDIPALRELLGAAAIYVPAADAAALAEAVDLLLADPKRRAELAAQATARAVDFQWSQLTATWLSLYDACAAIAAPATRPL